MTENVLKENEGGCCYVLRIGKDFLNTAPEAQNINEKTHTFDYIRLFKKQNKKNFFYIKDILNKVKNTNL